MKTPSHMVLSVGGFSFELPPIAQVVVAGTDTVVEEVS